MDEEYFGNVYFYLQEASSIVGYFALQANANVAANRINPAQLVSYHGVGLLLWMQCCSYTYVP